MDSVRTLCEQNFIPIFHGDVVLDDSLGCSVMSSDSVVAFLAIYLPTKYVTLLTDVAGVYDKNPIESKDAKLIQSIVVHKQSGKLSITIDAGGSKSTDDTTGGMKLKLDKCLDIVKYSNSSTVVYLTEGGTEDGLSAMLGDRPKRGTMIST